MTATSWLWVLLGINTAIYAYVGRAVISQPRHNLPQLFWNPNMVWLAGCFPPTGYLAIAVAGFLLTDSGWRLLAASAFAYAVLAVRPRIYEP